MVVSDQFIVFENRADVNIPSQVADSLLLVHSAGAEVDPQGQLCLDCCFSQGLPATLHAIQVSAPTWNRKLFPQLSCCYGNFTLVVWVAKFILAIPVHHNNPSTLNSLSGDIAVWGGCQCCCNPIIWSMKCAVRCAAGLTSDYLLQHLPTLPYHNWLIAVTVSQ